MDPKLIPVEGKDVSTQLEYQPDGKDKILELLIGSPVGDTQDDPISLQFYS